MQKKSGLLFTPLAVLFLVADREKTKTLLSAYCILISTAAIFLLCAAFIQYTRYNTTSVFFYHALVAPFRYHAVYFSILVFISLVFLLQNLTGKTYVLNKSFHASLIFFLSFFLFLLASKLVLTFYVVYLFFLLLKPAGKNKLSRLFAYSAGILIVFSAAFVLITKNPVGDRFRDFAGGNISLINQQKFSQTTYFNGLQFRLLQWKLVPQILNETHCWWTGVGTGDAQTFLNRKYVALNMYHGDPHRQGHGYLDYNTHNQLLQSMLESGIPGGIIFLFICISLVRLAWQVNKRMFSFIIALLLIYVFVESLFEEQYGIVIFTFWPLFIYQYYTPNREMTANRQYVEKTV